MRDARIAELIQAIDTSKVTNARASGLAVGLDRMRTAADADVASWSAFCAQHGEAVLPDIDTRLRSEEPGGRIVGMRALASFVVRRAGTPPIDRDALELVALLFLRALNDTSEAVRVRAVAAVKTIALLHPEWRSTMVEALAGRLADSSENVRLEAARALLRLGEDARVPNEVRARVREAIH